MFSRKNVDTLKTIASDNRNEELKSRLNELHNQMSEDTLNADNITETILRRVEKLLCDEVSDLSSSSDSPESSCTSFSKSESGSGVIAFWNMLGFFQIDCNIAWLHGVHNVIHKPC